MSSVYQKPYTIPEGFPALLKEFTREILRAQPENIYQFGAEYFAEKLNPGIVANKDPNVDLHLQETALEVDVSQLDNSDAETLVLGIFIMADVDKSGFLDRLEFSNVLRNADLKLNERQIRQILSEADDNEDNVIEYREFLPVMVDILQGMRADQEAQQMVEEADVLVTDAVEDLLLRGMSREDLEKLMMQVFSKSDVDKNGTLDRKEFKHCLRSAHLGLTRKDINLVMSSIDLNGDGVISYKEFVPVCYQVLVERFKDEAVANQIARSEDSLQKMLLEAFQAGDPERTGFLSRQDVKSILKVLSYEALGLNTLQLVNLISRAPTSADGLIQYLHFVPIASTIIYRIYDVDSMKLRIQAVKSVSLNESMEKMASLDFEELKGILEKLFLEVDVDNKGVLSQDEVMLVLEKLGTLDSYSISDFHKAAMFTAVDTNEDGMVDWPELVSFICDAIEHVERENYIETYINE